MKTFFNSKTMRERVMLTAFLLIVATFWARSLSGRWQLQQGDWQLQNAELARQQELLVSQEPVMQRLASVTAKLDPKKTMNATAAFAEINRMGQGMAVELGAQRTERTDDIAMHSLQATLRRVDLPTLLKLYQQISQQAPYIGIEHCVITSERSSPGQVSAVFRIYSIEVLNPPSP